MDILPTLLAVFCVAAAVEVLFHVARGAASWLTAFEAAVAAAIWSVLVGAPIWAPVLGAALALACVGFLIADEQAEIEELMS